jgi:tetratricopeptide (TPR) repeat protein
MRFITSLILAALVLTSAATLLGQDRKKRYESKTKAATRSADVSELLDDAKTDLESNPERSLERVKEALAQSLSDNNVQGEARCYQLLGDINMDIEEWKLALENYSTAYNILSIHYPKHAELSNILRGLGNASLKLGAYDEALKYYNTALGSSNRRSRPDLQVDISEVYYQQGLYDKALQVVESIQLDQKIADPAISVRIENQKAKIFAQTNDLDRASQSFQSSQRIIQSNRAAIPKREEEVMQSAKEEISNSLNEKQLYDQEISLRESSIEYNTESKNFAEVSKDKVELSKALVAKGETGAAITELEEAAVIADTIGDPVKQADAFLSLATLYEDRGNETKALAAYKRYSAAIGRSEKASESKLLEKSELIRQQRDIEEVARYVTSAKQEEKIAQGMVSRQRIIIYFLIVLVAITAVTSYFIYKNAQASKTANQLLALKSLRSQMNPHFIFNALNSLNHFVAQNDERTANKFLSEFSRLMRLVLENSQQDFIPLLKEEEIVSLYLKLEHYRFRDKFDYEITIDENINKEAISIPPMLIQPYIENAVWHGLRYKESKGHLSLAISQQNDILVVKIEDNGIGRKRSAELKTENQKKHRSTGLKNIRERLGIINRIYHSHYKVFIEDLPADTGTKVILHLPVNTKHSVYA